MYPGLLVVLLLSAWVVGPLFTELSLHDYFSAKEVHRYITGNLKLKDIQFQLPGLFQDNPYPGINGSLWTLYYEVLLYAMVFALGVVGCLTRLRRVSVFFAVYFCFMLFLTCCKRTNTWSSVSSCVAGCSGVSRL